MDLDLRHAPVGGCADAPQDGSDTGFEDPGLDGLDDIVVGSRLQPDHDVHVVAPGGRHDDRDLVVVGADPAADVQSRHAREHQVKDHDIRPVGPQPSEPVLAGRGDDDVVSLTAQRKLDTLAYRAVVFDQQDTWHAHKYPYSGLS